MSISNISLTHTPIIYRQIESVYAGHIGVQTKPQMHQANQVQDTSWIADTHDFMLLTDLFICFAQAVIDQIGDCTMIN